MKGQGKQPERCSDLVESRVAWLLWGVPLLLLWFGSFWWEARAWLWSPGLAVTCEACAIHLQGALGDVAGLKSASVSYADGHAVLNVNADAAPTRNELAAIIEEAGYTVK